MMIALRYPYAGVLLWAWLAIQNPHQEAYGFVQTASLNFAIAIVTVVSLFFSKERKLPQNDLLLSLLIAFLVWMTFNSFFAFNPNWSWPFWDRTWKTFALGFCIAATAVTRVRIQAMIWIVVISLFYFGVKGGLFTIMTGGHFHVLGPPNTPINDNNTLATVLLMSLPFANYLRLYSANRYVGLLLTMGIVLTVISILGSYSRGAFIGLAALAMYGILRAKRKFLYLGSVAVIAVIGLALMPPEYFGRLNSIGAAAAKQDDSFSGRVTAWQVAFYYARDHFPFGAGYYGPQLKGIYNYYFPYEYLHAAHSIYFQVLGEHGFVGLFLYMAILVIAFFRCSKIASIARFNPATVWVSDLAVAIQASLFVFYVAGAALSLAYYDLFIIEVVLLLPLEVLARQGNAAKVPWSARPKLGQMAEPPTSEPSSA